MSAPAMTPLRPTANPLANAPKTAASPFAKPVTPALTNPGPAAVTSTASPLAPVTTEDPVIAPAAPVATPGMSESDVRANLARAGYNGAPAVPKLTPQQIDSAEQANRKIGEKTPISPEVPQGSAAVSTAEKAYQNALNVTPEEKAAQEELDLLAESARQGYQNTRGQAIPMQFITGQLKAQEERATGLQEPLERKLARMQAARTNSLSASKFALERADKAADASKPTTMTVGAGQTVYRYDPTTGKTEAVASGEQERKTETITANGRSILVDKNTGEVIQDFGYAGTKDPAAATASTAVSELKSNALKAASDLLERFNSGKGTSAVGKSSIFGSLGYGLLPGTDRADFVKSYDNLKSLLSLENVSLLKGQGSITDSERRLLADASTKLDRNLSETEFKNVLEEINRVLGSKVRGGTGALVVDSPDGPVEIID
jgi:hypothetical protein